MLALICFYLILKKYVNTFIAFAFSLLLANNYVFLNFSRTAWVNQITIFTILATILFLLNFYKTKSIKWLVLSAIFSGITLYGYHYGRIFITFLIIFIIFYSLLRKGVRHLRKAALFFLISLVIFSPYLYKIILNSGESILRRPVATFAFSQTKLTPEGGLFS
ncbi:MAG: hypothetical protein ACD_12C00536G0001, partial [uncultured bacterium]